MMRSCKCFTRVSKMSTLTYSNRMSNVIIKNVTFLNIIYIIYLISSWHRSCHMYNVSSILKRVDDPKPSFNNKTVCPAIVRHFDWFSSTSLKISLRDRPFNLKGLEYLFFFVARNAIFFSKNLTLGYMTKTLNQIIFFSSTKIRIFFSATLGIRIFF